MRTKIPISLLVLMLVVTTSSTAFAGAKVKIVNGDGPNEGFNDPTPVPPAPGNNGKTLGKQRQIAFQFAANIWGATLPDIGDYQIRVFAQFNALTCSPAGVVLGSAGPITVWSDFPGATFSSTWYHASLANKLAGFDLLPGPKIDPVPSFSSFVENNEIIAQFNSGLGVNPACAPSFWYYGLDTNTPPNGINLVAVLLHEFGHGLGFSNFVNEATGVELGDDPMTPAEDGLDDIYSKFTRDNTTGKTWDTMTNAERQASAVNTSNVVLIGSNVTNAVNNGALTGNPTLTVNSPGGIAGSYLIGPAGFGSAFPAVGLTGNVELVNDGVGVVTNGCEPLPPAGGPGRIALIDRGLCTFVTKVLNAQNAGYAGVLIADNVAGSPPAGLGGCNGAITIPSGRITLADGNTIKANLGTGVNVTMGTDPSDIAGADGAGNAQVYAPSVVALGSSISHYDTAAYPNQLMEPFINCNLTHSVQVPQDLTFELLKDLGW
ncbi:MAG: PA domain-containing protein [Terriglobales bacterium]